MRVALVGPELERDRLRWRLEGTGLTVVGEFAAVDDARRSGVDVEALVVVPDGHHALRPVGADPDAEALTPREIEVLELLAEGLPNKAIAARLGISDQTVKFHVAAICGKLGAANRTDAVRRAIRRGIVAI
jgi:DNA-binding NarL/FixJ family response regulator